MTLESPTKIQLLPEHIIDQIKAGEVIERPSTLIKEILENSIDANSTKISLTIINNGIDLISIEDNGKGIPSSDLPLAFCRHATSKISKFEDIYRLHSYGFRGEALASIASISRITCESFTSKTKGIIKIDGGMTLLHKEEENLKPVTGTKIFIKDLFFNTPVRMKFIQSKTSEKNHIKKIINSFLLNYPQIEFHIKLDNDEKNIYPQRIELTDRIKDTLFPNKKINFTQNESSYDGVHYKVILTKESTKGNAHKSHYIFINKRYVQDISIHKIILNSAKSLWPEGESGHYISFIDIPTDELDVNIHPNKTVVKLFKAPKIYSIISGTIKSLLNEIAHERSPISLSSQTEQPQSFNFENIESTFKDVEYRQVDFSNENEVQNYFTDIHNSDQTSLASEVAIKPTRVGQFSIIFLNDNYYIIKNHRLFKETLRDFLSSNDLKDSIVPLLVSRPLKVKKVKDATITFLNSLGFETDFLSKDTLVIRTFPQKLQSIPYLKIVELICELNSSSVNELLDSNFKIEDSLYEDQVDTWIEHCGIALLLRRNIATLITEKKLSQIYEE